MFYLSVFLSSVDFKNDWVINKPCNSNSAASLLDSDLALAVQIFKISTK